MSNLAGWITVGTKVDTKGLKKGIKDVKKGLEGFESSSALGLTALVGVVAALAVSFIGLASAFKKAKENNSDTYVKLEQILNSIKNLVEGVIDALANVFAPILDKIVNALYRAMQYVGYLMKAWFNIDIFADRANKNTKEMKKSLAGFDEVNTLGAGGNDENAITSSITPLEDGKVPEWLKWLGEHGTEVATAIGLIAGAVLLLKMNTADFMALGIFAIIYGIYTFIKGIVQFIENPSWENFTKILKGLAFILGGIAVLMIAINAANPVGWIMLAIAAVVLLISKFKSAKDLGKALVNGLIDGINRLIDGLNTLIIPLRVIILGIAKALGKNWSFNDIKVPHIPRLAKGGIVNNPGAGVNIGSAIAGEEGAEAVIPLTDDTLQRLANMIPITIDLTNKMDGRVLNNMLIQARNNQSMMRGGI